MRLQPLGLFSSSVVGVLDGLRVLRDVVSYD
jgi:hypothetical protein